MFFLLVLLTAAGGLQAGLDSHKKFLQTTVPEKISSSDTESDPENNVAYMITIKGTPYFVHLKKQSFLSPVSVVYSYDKDDTQEANLLLDQMDCNYYGYIAGFPNSLVSLNICSGLRGLLQLENISYGIEPMETVSEFMHMIYEDKDYNTNIPLLRYSGIYIYNISEHQDRKSSKRVEFFKLSPQYLEIYIVVDKNLFDYMGSDIKLVTQSVIQIIGLVNTMFTQLKLTVVISSIEIWSNENKISIKGHPNYILSKFIDWKSKHVSRSYHAAYLLAFKEHFSVRGATVPEKICHKDLAAGVALYPEGSSLESYTVSIVQLLGFLVGLRFDNTDTCYCSGDVCTMSPEAVHSRGVKDFSTCSLDEFKYLASHSGFACLHNSLHVNPIYKTSRKVCGNGVLEPGEQCDCGTITSCTHKECCNPTTCKLKHEKDCGSGECCTQDCKLKPGGTLCRPSLDECDFIDFCNGVEPHCVPDTFARNGEPCNSGEAYCYKGRCRLFDQQCRKLIGGGSRGAPFACYEEINSRGDRYGNCGRHYCDYSSLMCGKLVCTWPYKKLVPHENLSVIYTHVRDELCVSTFLDTDKVPKDTPTTYETHEDRDVTFVEDGTVCGPEMYCINFRCYEIKHRTSYNLCNNSYNCGDKGICNNFNHCHCHKGYAPPFCIEMKGEFGSLDDGHIIKSRRSLGQRATTSPKHRFQLIFYISLPVLIITAAILIKQDKIRELCYRSGTESERSVSEESSNNSKYSQG